MESTRVERSGRIEWRNTKDEFHRLDGPAITWNDGMIYTTRRVKF